MLRRADGRMVVRSGRRLIREGTHVSASASNDRHESCTVETV
jgi:hypothetical protein